MLAISANVIKFVISIEFGLKIVLVIWVGGQLIEIVDEIQLFWGSRTIHFPIRHFLRTIRRIHHFTDN